MLQVAAYLYLSSYAHGKYQVLFPVMARKHCNISVDFFPSLYNTHELYIPAVFQAIMLFSGRKIMLKLPLAVVSGSLVLSKAQLTQKTAQ